MPARTAGVPPAASRTPVPVRTRDRRWPVPPRLAAAFLIATTFHLSMVTLFRIVVVFPETQAKYCQVQIFSEAPPMVVADASPRTEPGGLHLRGPQLAEARIELPTMDFTELKQLQVRSEAGTDPAAMYPAFEPSDLWGKTAVGLQDFGLTLLKMAFPETPAAPQNTRRVVAKHHPAPGYNGEIVWDTEPRDRELLFAPPISALADAANAGLHWPVEVVLTVTPAGRVVGAYCPPVDDAGVVTAIQAAAMTYRFAPLPADAGAEAGAAAKQMATLFIRPAEEQP